MQRTSKPWDAAQLRLDFQKFLECGGYSTPPGRAACALANARTLLQWRKLQAAGFVRIRQKEDTSPYDPGDDGAYTNVHGRRVSEEEAKKEIAQMLERFGNWAVVTDYYDDGVWKEADSVCGCVGYRKPCDPFENCYVPQLMAAAIQQCNLRAHVAACVEVAV